MTILTNILLIILIVLIIIYFGVHIYWNYHSYRDDNKFANIEKMLENTQNDFIHEKQNYQKIIDNYKIELSKWQNFYKTVQYENEKLHQQIKENLKIKKINNES